jgi:hypothetical protein
MSTANIMHSSVAVAAGVAVLPFLPPPESLKCSSTAGSRQPLMNARRSDIVDVEFVPDPRKREQLPVVARGNVKSICGDQASPQFQSIAKCWFRGCRFPVFEYTEFTSNGDRPAFKCSSTTVETFTQPLRH